MRSLPLRCPLVFDTPSVDDVQTNYWALGAPSDIFLSLRAKVTAGSALITLQRHALGAALAILQMPDPDDVTFTSKLTHLLLYGTAGHYGAYGVAADVRNFHPVLPRGKEPSGLRPLAPATLLSASLMPCRVTCLAPDRRW